MSWLARRMAVAVFALGALAGEGVLAADSPLPARSANRDLKRARHKAEIERALADSHRWRVFSERHPVTRVRSEIEDSKVGTRTLPPPAMVSDDELRALAARAERWLSKVWVSDIVSVTVFEGGFSEIEIYRGARKVKALVNVDFSEIRYAGVIETEERIFQPLILLVTSPESVFDVALSNDEALRLGYDRGLLHPLPDAASMPLVGGPLEYVVGYDPSVGIGENADYETLDALLDFHEVAMKEGTRE